MKGGCLLHLAALFCSVLAILLYLNTLDAELVFDDTAAILTNKDLLPTSPWSNLLYHDFWGDDIHHVKSHKSFRPITSATFKLNYHLHQEQPMHYHSVNIILNALVSYLFVLFAGYAVFHQEIWPAFLAGILYTVHPLHTEAVAGVVGRAELLASIFFLLTLFVYRRAADSKQVGWQWLILSMFLCLCSMLSKEQGITVIAICVLYEAFIIFKLNLRDGLDLLNTAVFNPHKLSKPHRNFLARLLVLFVFLVIVFGARVSLMDGGPKFSNADNPGQRLKTPLRQLYFLHLIFSNVWLFLSPSKLRHDWRFGPVPLFDSVSDPRSILTLITFISLAILGLSYMLRKSRYTKIAAFSFSLSVITFLPSSNLIFLIGFVVAERVLYVPTMGACLLVATGMWKVLTYEKIARIYKTITKFAIVYLVVIHSVKTVHRNRVWQCGFNMYVDALKLYPADGLMFSNLGYDFGKNNMTSIAEECHIMAVKLAPVYSQPYRNYGSLLANQGRFDEAEKVYRRALEILGLVLRSKRTRRAQTYHALADIVSKNESRTEEAILILDTIIKIEPDEFMSYQMQMKLLIKLNRTQEVTVMFRKAIQLFPNSLELKFYAADACYLMGDRDCAKGYYTKIISLDKYQGLAMLKYGEIIAEKESAPVDEMLKAHKYLRSIIRVNSSITEAFYSLALIDFRLNRLNNSQENFHQALSLDPSHSGSIKNLAKLYYTTKNYSKVAEILGSMSERELSLKENGLFLGILGESYWALGLRAKAEQLYRTVVQQNPEHTDAILALGKINANSKDYDEAERLFERAQQLNKTNKEAQVMLNKVKQLKRTRV